MRLATAPAASSNSPVTKAELRARLVAELRAAAPRREQRQAASDAICRAIRRHPAWIAAKSVCAFLPLPSEPQIAPLWEDEHAPAFCFPRVRGDEVKLIRLDDPALLRRSNWRLEADELAAAPIVEPGDVDLFLVPGLAFTARGQRLGRGGGFYDRLLSKRSAHSTAIGICFSQQIVTQLPREPHDQDVDAVITEHGLLAGAADHTEK